MYAISLLLQNESKYKVQFGFLVEFIGVCVSICFVLFTCVVHGTVNQVCIAEPATSNISTFKIIQLRRLVWVPLNQQSVRACSQSKITARNLLTLTFPYSKGGHKSSKLHLFYKLERPVRSFIILQAKPRKPGAEVLGGKELISQGKSLPTECAQLCVDVA